MSSPHSLRMQRATNASQPRPSGLNRPSDNRPHAKRTNQMSFAPRLARLRGSIGLAALASMAVAAYDAKGAQSQKVVRFLMPLGLLLQPGVRFAVDQGQATPGRYAICFPNGCFAEAPGLKDDVINQMKKGTTLNVSVQNQAQREVTFAVPLAGFGKAFDGPAIDPKVLQDQQQKLQEEMQKRSEEMRRKLEQGGGAT